MNQRIRIILTGVIFLCYMLIASAQPINQNKNNMKPTPFKIDIPQKVLDDLKARLKQTRWPDEAKDAGWSHGTNKTYLQGLVDYWLNKYDWKKHEASINHFPQFTTEIDGIKIHFIHVKGKGPNPKPIILTHGWPDCFYRFHKVIPMLTDPASYGADPNQSFDVIVPSIPGFGFSDRTAIAGSAVADLWAKLMIDVLGYKKFFAAGGDVGSGVTKELALRHPAIVEAIHLTDVSYPTGQEDFSTMSKAEQDYAAFVQNWWYSEGAYAMVQMTKPQSIAYGLNDSPTGLAAWILSFGSAGAPPEMIEAAFGGRDELLTNIMIYWITETAGSSARMYLEEARAAYGHGGETPSQKKSTVPTGIAVFPREASFPKEWAERSLNVQRYTKMSTGGHFAALEVPALFVNDIRTFFISTESKKVKGGL